MRLLRHVILFALVGCATTRAPGSPSQPVVLSVQNLVCSDCGKELEQLALQQPGVREAHFDEKTVELALQLAPGTSAEPIIAALEKEPVDGRRITASAGAGHGRYAPFEQLRPEWDAKVLSSHGEDVEGFSPTPGRVTVVDFYADWCGPCHELDSAMHKELEAHPDRYAYRRLNVVDWDSPLAKHYLADASELPLVIVLDAHGRERARLSGFRPDEFASALRKAAQP